MLNDSVESQIQHPPPTPHELAPKRHDPRRDHLGIFIQPFAPQFLEYRRQPGFPASLCFGSGSRGAVCSECFEEFVICGRGGGVLVGGPWVSCPFCEVGGGRAFCFGARGRKMRFCGRGMRA